MDSLLFSIDSIQNNEATDRMINVIYLTLQNIQLKVLPEHKNKILTFTPSDLR